MDELLALMDEDDANRQRQQQQQQQQQEVKTNATCQDNDDEDDPLADFIGADSAFQEEINTSLLSKLSKSSSAQTNSNHSQKTTSSKRQGKAKHLPPPQRHNHLATAGIDSRLGIRMIQRHMSSVELTEFLSINEQSYHSPAALAAMSLRQRNQLLVDPAQVVNAATVTGATTLATVGLILYHSGTRLSANNGNAFCVIHLGTFAAGACCSVLLFGTAYSQHCQTLVPGQVALLCHPKLMAQNNKNSNNKNDTTTITFSCSEASQIQRIATARDYGTCAFQGMRIQMNGGQWSNTGQCRQFIDKRCGAYCAKHKQHGKTTATTSSSSTVGTKRNSLSKLTQMRQEQLSLRSAIPLPQPQTHSSTAAAGSNRFLNPGAAGNVSVVASSGLASRGVPRQMMKPPPPPQPQRAAAPPSGRPNSNRFLLHPSSANSSTARVTKTAPPPMLRSNHNPYAKQKSTTTTTAAKVTPVPAPPSTKRRNNNNNNNNNNTTDLLGSSLQQKKSSSTSHNKSRKRPLSQTMKSSTPAVGVEGSVLVPAPSKLLFGSNTTTSNSSKVLIPPQRSAPSASTRNHSQKEEERNKILNQQRQYAERLKKQGQSSQSSNKKNNKKIKTSNGTALQQHQPSKSSETQRQDFFHSLPAVDLDKVRTQKSRFQHEAEAEQYAKSRQALLELEQVEERSSSKTNPQQQAASKKLSNEWHCKTCNRVFTKRPNVCHVKGHVLTIQRKLLKHPVSKTDQRTKLNETSAEDGGLRLGAGLDWSRWGQFS